MRLDVKFEGFLMKANLYEIFCSIQGEGLLVGTKQVFLRLTGCNLRCSYCDTMESFSGVKECLIYPVVGKTSGAKLMSNPVSVSKICNLIDSYSAPWLSLTGGEPLLQAEFMEELLLHSKDSNYKVLLETNGSLPDHLTKIIDYLDCISMDMKLPNVVGKELWDEHQEFLRIAAKKPIYIKIIITPDYEMKDFAKALQIIKKIDINIPLFIQPVTPKIAITNDSIDIYEAISLQSYALGFINDVRILPQIHPWLKLT